MGSIHFFNASFNANSSLCVRHQTNPTHGVSWRTIVISLFFTPVLTETPFEPRNTTLDNKYPKFAYLKADLWLNKCLAQPYIFQCKKCYFYLKCIRIYEQYVNAFFFNNPRVCGAIAWNTNETGAINFVLDICINYWFGTKWNEIFASCFIFIISTWYTFNLM